MKYRENILSLDTICKLFMKKILFELIIEKGKRRLRH